MESALFGIGLLILVRFLSTVFGLKCSRSQDCDICGICIDKYPSNGECYFPYPEIEVINSSCHFKHDLCGGYSCENEGVCKSQFGFAGPVCHCDYSKYYMGQRCEILWDKSKADSWVSGIAVLFDQFRLKKNKVPLYSIYIFPAVYSAARNLQFYLETSKGFVIRFNNFTEYTNLIDKRTYPYYPLCQACSATLPSCKLVYQARVQFPYELALGPSEMITKSGEVIGYKANITLVAKTWNMGYNQEVYRTIHPIIVNYEGLREDERLHMPVIELQNCGRNLEERIYYQRKNTISLNAKVKDIPRDSDLPIWTLWEVDKFRTDYDTISDMYQINEGYSWTIKPFTLKRNIYRIQIKVTIVYGLKSVSNYGDCYLEIIKTAVIAIISGGYMKTINKQFPVIISGEKSYNPNKKKNTGNLYFFWSCSPECENIIPKASVTLNKLIIPGDMMTYNKTYNFTLKVSADGLEDGWASQSVYVSHEEMSMYCLMNCLSRVVPSDPLLLEVRLSSNKHLQHTFVWTISNENKIKIDTSNITCKSNTFPSYLLCIEPRILNYGNTYYAHAKQVDSYAVAELRVQIGQVPIFSCIITPTKGVQSKTLFRIKCSKPDGQSSWIYEYFDKRDSDLDLKFSGRMIATNDLGVLREFKMFRGIVVVYLFDMNGIESQWKQAIELTPYNATKNEIDSLFDIIEYMVDKREFELGLKDVSLISELIGSESDKTYIAERMVKLICKISYESQRIMKLGLVTVKNFIQSLTKEGDFKIGTHMLRALTQVIHSLTHWTDYVLRLSDTAVPSIIDGMLEQMIKASVEVIEALFVNRNERFLDTSLRNMNPVEHEDALQASIQVDLSLRRLGRVLSFRQSTGYTKTSVTSSTNLSFVSAQTDYLVLIADKINKNRNSSLKISEKLLKELGGYVEELSVHLTVIRYNPFWSSSIRSKISTNLISLDLYNKRSLDFEMTRINNITNDIDLFIEVLHPKVGSVVVMVTQLDPTVKDKEDLDTQLTVLRLDMSEHSKLFLSFSFQDNSDQIKIYVNDRIRPDYKLVNKSATIISSNNASYNKSTGVGDSEKFVYVGILPGSKVPVNKTVTVTVHIHYILCLTWFKHDWMSQFCKVGDTTTSSNVHCTCNHLSFFSAIFAVPPNEVNPFNDIKLFLTVKDNWFIVLFMTCLLLAFLLLGVWAKYKDARNKIHRTVLVLEDNFPGDKSYFLLAVFTGSRINAGTEANIGVQIDGSESSSHSHILKSSRRKVLTRNSEDWFLIQTSTPLGVITQIHVWSDNSGVSPDWYCNKMVVYDLQSTIVYTFFVEQWLALESDEFCEAVLFPATSEEMCNIKRIILENITFGFREGDLSGSILARHPRSRIERLDRVVILMCFIMLALFVSLAFYKVDIDNDDDLEGVDDFGFSFEPQDILISFESFVISSVFLFLISVSFSKAYKPIQGQRSHGNASFVYVRPNQQSSLLNTPIQEQINLDEYSFYHRLVRRILRTFHPLPLCPVALSKASAKVKTNRIFYFVAWLISGLLIACCVFFILLYGLKLGQEESKKWLASMALVLVQEFFIMSPLKIILIGLILATTFQRFAQISNYSVTIEDLMEEKEAMSDSYYPLLITKRSHPMYKPLNVTQSDMMRKNKKMKKISHNLVDLVLVIVYIVIICLVTYDYCIHVQSINNFHVSQMVKLKHKSKQMNFRNIHNRTLYYDYLDNTFTTALYANKWYNNEILSPLQVNGQGNWWTMDKVTKLVGPPVCRQIRVDPKKCLLNKITENSSVECIPNWSPDVEDDDDYSYGWKIATTSEAKHEPSAWTYVSPSQSNRVSRQGESWTTYHGGGYMVSLNSDGFETERIIEILTESKWINEFTRVVFLDLTLFNVNEHMFTEVVLIAEHFPFGLYITRTIIGSIVHLNMVQSMWNVGFVLFLLIIMFHIIKILRLMNRKGFLKYFSEFVNIYQLFLTGLGVLSIVCFVVHLKVSFDYIEMFQRRGLDVFFEFDKIVYYSTITEISLKILFCCLSFRLFSLWPFGGNSLNIYNTLLLSGKSIVRFLVVLVVHSFVFCRLVSYLLNQMLPFSAFYWLWSKSVHKCLSNADFMVQFMLSFLVKLCLLYILMLFCYQYKLGKRKIVPPSDFVVFMKWVTSLKR